MVLKSANDWKAVWTWRVFLFDSTFQMGWRASTMHTHFILGFAFFFTFKLLLPLFVTHFAVSPWGVGVFGLLRLKKKIKGFHFVYTHMHTLQSGVLNQVWNCSHTQIEIWMKHCTDRTCRRLIRFFTFGFLRLVYRGRILKINQLFLNGVFSLHFPLKLLVIDKIWNLT